jgi:hypothetical protein
MFDYIKQDGNAPLIYVIMRIWSMAFGSGDLSFRVLAVLISTSLVPVAYLLFRDWLGKARAVQIAMLMALCAPLVHFSNLTRGYGLLPLLSLVCTYQAIMLLERGPTRKQSIAYVITLALTVYLHHWGAMMAVGHGVMALAGAFRKWWSWPRFFQWLRLALMAALLYAPWAVILAYQLKSDVSPWILQPGWNEILFYTAVEGLSGYRDTPQIAHVVNMIWANLIFWTTLLIPVVSRLEASAPSPAFRSRPWQIVVGAGIAAAAIISQFRSIWRDRYLMVFTPLLLVLQPVVFSRFTGKFPRWLALAIPILVWLPTWIPQLIYFHNFPESGTWILAEEIGKQADPAKDLVVVSFEAIAPQVHRYLPRETRVVSFPDIERVTVIRWAGMNDRVRDEARLLQLINLMDKTLKNGGNIWLIESVHNYIPAPLNISMEGENFNVVETLRMCQIRTWLLEHAEKSKDDLWAPGREFPAMASRFSPDRK